MHYRSGEWMFAAKNVIESDGSPDVGRMGWQRACVTSALAPQASAIAASRGSLPASTSTSLRRSSSRVLLSVVFYLSFRARLTNRSQRRLVAARSIFGAAWRKAAEDRNRWIRLRRGPGYVVHRRRLRFAAPSLRRKQEGSGYIFSRLCWRAIYAVV